MKKIIGIIVFFLFCGHLAAFAQQQEVIDNVRTALKSGSYKELVKYFHNPVELSLNDEKSSYSISEAENVLKTFFKEHQATDFSYIHEGASREGLKYIIGKYKSSTGNYRVYMLIKAFDKRFLVETLDISEE